MINIEESELKKINGGAISGWAIAGIGALSALVIGILDGIVHPKRCEQEEYNDE